MKGRHELAYQTRKVKGQVGWARIRVYFKKTELRSLKLLSVGRRRAGSYVWTKGRNLGKKKRRVSGGDGPE